MPFDWFVLSLSPFLCINKSKQIERATLLFAQHTRSRRTNTQTINCSQNGRERASVLENVITVLLNCVHREKYFVSIWPIFKIGSRFLFFCSILSFAFGIMSSLISIRFSLIVLYFVASHTRARTRKMERSQRVKNMLVSLVEFD